MIAAATMALLGPAPDQAPGLIYLPESTRLQPAASDRRALPVPAAFPRPSPSGAALDGPGGLLAHLQRSPLFREYQEAFESVTGLPLVLRAAGSFQSPLHGSKRQNPFCALMARGNQSCGACLRLQQQTEEQATREPVTLECFAGLVESAVPIRVGHKLVGYLQTGQVLLRRPTQRRFRTLVRAIGRPRIAAEARQREAAYFETRVIERRQYDLIIRLLAIFAQQLAATCNQVLVRAATSEPPAMTKARTFIAAHQGEDLHFGDVARAVNMSAFHFCKLFKGATSLTFTDYLGSLRVEVVKEMLLNVHVRISEAAFAAGFQSISQFNRVFRRIEGEPPTVYRRRLTMNHHSLVTGRWGVEETRTRFRPGPAKPGERTPVRCVS